MRKEIKVNDKITVIAELVDDTVSITALAEGKKFSRTTLVPEFYLENVTEQNLDYLFNSYFDLEFDLTADEEKILRKALRPFVATISDKDED